MAVVAVAMVAMAVAMVAMAAAMVAMAVAMAAGKGQQACTVRSKRQGARIQSRSGSTGFPSCPPQHIVHKPQRKTAAAKAGKGLVAQAGMGAAKAAKEAVAGKGRWV